MKKIWNKILGINLVVTMIGVTMLPIGIGASEIITPSEKIDVVFTHDLHSHLEPFTVKTEDGQEELGGFARIANFIKSKQSEAEDLLVLDAGDFSMGTLYQTIYETRASELRLLGEMGYDVTTLGNHEFDYRTQGITHMMEAAVASRDMLPNMVVCNIDWKASFEGEYVEENIDLKEAFDAYGVKPYVMLEKNNLNIAVIGVFGKQSLKYSPTCTLTFTDPVEAVRETVKEIQANEDADMIICVSHSGTWKDIKKSEDEILAKAVPELDLIVSGHTHTKLEEPIVHGHTAIVSAGEYGKYVGSFSMVSDDKRWRIEDYELVPMDESIGIDTEIDQQIKAYGEQINESYLKQFGYSKEQVLAYNPWQYMDLKEMSSKVQEQPFANLLSDAYLYTMEQMGLKQENEEMLAVVPMGVIRDVFPTDKEITVSNVYDAFSLGIGEDGIPGYPLIRIYLTGEEIKMATEIDASITDLMNTAQLFISGLSYEMNPNRLILNRVTDVKLMNSLGETSNLEKDKLYPVVTDMYSGQMLGSVTGMSYNLISIMPKDEQGNPIKELNDAIIYQDGKEVKAWTAIANYIESFSKKSLNNEDEVGSIPEYYSKPQGRKIIVDDKSISAILTRPNALIIKLGIILLGIVTIVSGLIVFVIKQIKKKKRRINKR